MIKKTTQTNIKTIKAVDFERTENMQSIEWTNDKMDKMTSSTNDNGEYQMITTAHISNTKTYNLQTKFLQKILTTLKSSVETEVQAENFSSDSDFIPSSNKGEVSKGVEYTITQKNTGNEGLTTVQSDTGRPVVSTKIFSQKTEPGISSSGEYVDKQTLDVANQEKESKPTQKVSIHQESVGSMTPKTLSTENTKSPDHKSSEIVENSKTSSTTETKDTLEIDNDANPNNLDPSTTASLPTTLCECPTISTTSKQSTTPGIRTTSGTCICPDTSERRRQRQICQKPLGKG